MRNLRCYYSADITEFLNQSSEEIFGVINANNVSAETTIQQSNTWREEIAVLKDQLAGFDEGRIIFEYTIPRMGKRVDNVVLYKNIVFLLEFKCGDTEYRSSTYDQVYDYALDLKNFQKESHNKLIVPIMVSTKAEAIDNNIKKINDIIEPLSCNSTNIAETINGVCSLFAPDEFDYTQWENSEYLPTPTIVEAAQVLYRGHNVHDITRSDAGAENLTVTTDEINNIIEYSKEHYYRNDKPVPIWAIFELISFGEFGQLVSCLDVNVKKNISTNIGFYTSHDRDGKLPELIVMTLKDLRNAVAHNDPVFDVRFKTSFINYRIQNYITFDTGIVNVDFKSIVDYIILISYLMKLLKVNKNENKKFLRDFMDLCESLRNDIPISVYNKIIPTNTRNKIQDMISII